MMRRVLLCGALLLAGCGSSQATPKPIVEKMASEVTRIMRAADNRERWSGVGVEPTGSTPAEFKVRYSAELEKWKKVVTAMKLAPD